MSPSPRHSRLSARRCRWKRTIEASDLAALGVTRVVVTVRPFSITADGMDPDTNPPWMLFRQDFALYVENAHE